MLSKVISSASTDGVTQETGTLHVFVLGRAAFSRKFLRLMHVVQ